MGEDAIRAEGNVNNSFFRFYTTESGSYGFHALGQFLNNRVYVTSRFKGIFFEKSSVEAITGQSEGNYIHVYILESVSPSIDFYGGCDNEVKGIIDGSYDHGIVLREGNTGTKIRCSSIICGNQTTSPKSGIYIAGDVEDVLIEGVRISNCYYAGIFILANGGVPKSIRISRCTFRLNGQSTDGGDIRNAGGDNITITNCELGSTGSVFSFTEDDASGIHTPSLTRFLYNKVAQSVTIIATEKIIKGNEGYTTENSGTATFSGDGTTTQFSIAHGLVSAPTKVLVTPMTADAASDFYVTADDTNIYINYKSAPPSGTDNLKFSWYAEV